MFGFMILIDKPTASFGIPRLPGPISSNSSDAVPCQKYAFPRASLIAVANLVESYLKAQGGCYGRYRESYPKIYSDAKLQLFGWEIRSILYQSPDAHRKSH